MQNTQHVPENFECASRRSVRNEIGAKLASCFGLGLLPLAPGTWGSIPPSIIFGLIYQLSASATLSAILMATLAAVASIVCVKFAPALIASVGKPDPRQIVSDEFAGQAVTFLISPFASAESVSVMRLWGTVLAGFVLFRVFDIFKPWPIRNLEKLPAGWGVLFDDILAGIYAAVTLQICVRLFPNMIRLYIN